MATRAVRGTRTTAEQQEIMLEFLKSNLNMLSGKTHPLNINQVNSLWQDLATNLNNVRGAKKSVEDWKRFWVEWKSRTKAKARLVKTDITCTGGGEAKGAQLNNLDNRLMDLIGWVSVTGSPDVPNETEPESVQTEECIQVVIEKNVIIEDFTETCQPITSIPINQSIEITCPSTPATAALNNQKRKLNDRETRPRKKYKSNTSFTGALHSSALIYADSAETISKALSEFAVGVTKLAEAIEKFAAATEKLATARNNV